jgi:hypothetical protein
VFAPETVADRVPTFLAKRDVEAMGKHPKLREDQPLMSLKNAKQKHKAREKRAKQKVAKLEFSSVLPLAKVELRKCGWEIRGPVDSRGYEMIEARGVRICMCVDQEGILR